LLATILESRRARLVLLACVAALAAALALAMMSGNASAQECDPTNSDTGCPPPPSDGGGGGGGGGGGSQTVTQSVSGGGDQSVTIRGGDGGGGGAPSFLSSFLSSFFLPDISVPSWISPPSPVFIGERLTPTLSNVAAVIGEPASPTLSNVAGPYRPGAATSSIPLATSTLSNVAGPYRPGAATSSIPPSLYAPAPCRVVTIIKTYIDASGNVIKRKITYLDCS
jgi:hypothetical protein